MEDQPDIVTPATAIAGAQVRIMPTGDAVVFPTMVFPIVVRDEPAVQLISDAAAADRNVALFSLKSPEEPVTADNFNDLGALASIIRLMRAPDGSVHVIMGGSGRVRLVEVTQREPYLMGLVEMAPETVVESTEVEALQRSLLSIFQR